MFASVSFSNCLLQSITDYSQPIFMPVHLPVWLNCINIGLYHTLCLLFPPFSLVVSLSVYLSISISVQQLPCDLYLTIHQSNSLFLSFCFGLFQVDALRVRLEEKEQFLTKKTKQLQDLTDEKSTLTGEIRDMKDMLDVKERKVNVLQKKVRDSR